MRKRTQIKKKDKTPTKQNMLRKSAPLRVYHNCNIKIATTSMYRYFWLTNGLNKQDDHFAAIHKVVHKRLGHISTSLHMSLICVKKARQMGHSNNESSIARNLGLLNCSQLKVAWLLVDLLLTDFHFLQRMLRTGQRCLKYNHFHRSKYTDWSV